MICPKCKAELKEQISIRGILFWKKKEVIFYCPSCSFENKRQFKLSYKDVDFETKDRLNKPTEKINRFISRT
jgi:RNase P subunit RPR2